MIDVIVPARNEQADLEQAARSILAQRSGNLRVCIVNDHSCDGTAEISTSIADSDERVTVIHDPELREGWFGKANAMQTGLEATQTGLETTTAPFVLFTDADVIHSLDCFAVALAEMEDRQLDFISLFPTVQLETFWENVIVPQLMIVGMVRFLTTRLDDPASDEAVAAGAMMMTRRTVLDRIGGLAGVKQEALDDVQLARTIKRHGFRTRFYFAPDLLRVRLFKTNRDAFWGFTKNILTAVHPVPLAIPLMFLPIFVYGTPLLTLMIGVAENHAWMIASAASAILAQATLLISASRLCSLRWSKAVCFPLAAIPIFCCFASALYHHYVRGGTTWRGRLLPRNRD
ncbi:glycosyltransferase [Novipirellula artificiosorum]|uniref:Putative glycosyltransferase EpsJ n=1 Tax=Novipirellula artificiosorum TaxID=2528016 RepID=A0A5C6D8M4_9BACT|nr:glycosyltransferase family 2 protein [Novipirellula artificiosorum]TWU31556.1 putative glycosyltransferase EpsJ [Novipirellula artificiosorum]